MLERTRLPSFLIAAKTWLDAPPAELRQALADAARASVTEKWRETREDDAQLVSALVARGASYRGVPANELAPWKERTQGVARKFEASHPQVMERFRAIVDSGER